MQFEQHWVFEESVIQLAENIRVIGKILKEYQQRLDIWRDDAKARRNAIIAEKKQKLKILQDAAEDRENFKRQNELRKNGIGSRPTAKDRCHETITNTQESYLPEDIEQNRNRMREMRIKRFSE